MAELKHMHQRITNLSRFMRGEYMDQHMQPESEISPHCMKCALTSLNDPAFKEKCEHDKSTEGDLNEPGALWANICKERLEMGPNSKTKKDWWNDQCEVSVCAGIRACVRAICSNNRVWAD